MPVLLGGDFRQIPPVLRRVDVHEFPAHTLKACDWWATEQNLKRYKLVQNKRDEGDPEFAKLILQIGYGDYVQETDTPQAAVCLPENFLARPHDNLKQLIEWTYGDLKENTENANHSNLKCVANRCTVAPTDEAAN